MDIEAYMINYPQIKFEYEQSQNNQVPLQLYDCQSDNQQFPKYLGIDQIIQCICLKQNIIDKSVQDLLQDAVDNYGLKHCDILEFCKRIKKNKNCLKRQRAKCRVFIDNKNIIMDKRTIAFQQSSTQKDTEVIQKQIKKQRNRMSAQVSRDRKKHYVQDLEQKNKKLSQQLENLRTQNQKLKFILFDKNQSAGMTSNKLNGKKNKLTSFLLFLGVGFFIYTLQDLFSSTINTSLRGSDSHHQHEGQLPKNTVIFESNIFMDEIRNKINQFQCQQQQFIFQAQPQTKSTSFQDIKQKILKKLNQFKRKTKQLLLPSRLASFLMISKNDITV